MVTKKKEGRIPSKVTKRFVDKVIQIIYFWFMTEYMFQLFLYSFLYAILPAFAVYLVWKSRLAKWTRFFSVLNLVISLTVLISNSSNPFSHGAYQHSFPPGVGGSRYSIPFIFLGFVFSAIGYLIYFFSWQKRKKE